MDYSDIIKEAIKGDNRFSEVLNLVRQNSRGKIWLVGSFVFRNIAHVLLRIPQPVINDFDFIAEEIKEKIILPDGWQFKINIYNGYKFYKEPLKVDLWSLKNTNSIIRRKLEPNIENYLTGVPLTIQSIAYDLLEEKVIGNIGLRSLENREISINDFDEIKSYTEKKRITNEDYINGKLTTWNLTGFKNKTICLKK